MASKLSPATPRPKLQRGSGVEAGERTPATVAKTGGSMFGYHNFKIENSPKASRAFIRPLGSEKRAVVGRGAELQQAQEDLAKTKEQLALLEKSKSNLLHDVSRSKRQVEDLTAKLRESNETLKREKMRAEEMELASFTAAEDWQTELELIKQQYEAAVAELQTNKQALEGLKHELVVCGEAKNEAVRLAGEAMNAAESTAKRVEELSAELMAAKGPILLATDDTPSKVKEVMGELLAERQSLREVIASHDIIVPGATVSAAKKAELKEVPETSSIATTELDNLKRELALAKDSELDLFDLNQGLGHLRDEIAAAKILEINGSLAVEHASADPDTVIAEVKKSRTPQSLVMDSAAAMAEELAVAQEGMITASVEALTFKSFVGYLKEELELNQLHIWALQRSEADANATAVLLQSDLIKLTDANHKEVMMLKEKESSAFALVESLQGEIGCLSSEVTILKDKHLRSETKVDDLLKKLKSNQAELTVFQQKEFNMALEAAALTSDIERKQMEVAELRDRVALLDDKATALHLELHRKQVEVTRHKNRALSMGTKATVLGVALTTLTENNQQELLQLREKERAANTKVKALSTELRKTKDDLEVALSSNYMASEAGEKLHKSLQSAEEEAQAAKAAAAHCKVEKSRALVQAQASRNEATKALEAKDAAEHQARSLLIEVKSAKEDAKAAREDAQAAKAEADAARRRMDAAVREAQVSKQELDLARLGIEAVTKESKLLQSKVDSHNEQAMMAAEETQAAKDKVLALQRQLSKALLNQQEANSALKNAKQMGQGALQNLETREDTRKEQGRNIVHTEEDGLNGFDGSVLQEPDHLKMKLHHMEERLAAAMLQDVAVQTAKAALCKELESTKLENEASKRAVLELYQQLADTEKAKVNMEAEMQRLLDGSKQWQVKDPIDIPVHSQKNGCTLSPDSREEKPQPDSIKQLMKLNLPGSKENQKEKPSTLEERLMQKEPEMVLEETSLPTKKKKKALLLRLGTYLDKKKN